MSIKLVVLGFALLPLVGCNQDDPDTKIQILQVENSALRDRLDAVEAKLAAQQPTLDRARRLLAVLDLNDVGDVVITGANLQVVNGQGETNPDEPNGRGNIFVGYNEDIPQVVSRTGSHNLVIGDHHSYTSTGGIVAGEFNEIIDQGASVLGGQANSATGGGAVVLGGVRNSARGINAVVCGGTGNSAEGQYSVVGGGSSVHATNDGEFKTSP